MSSKTSAAVVPLQGEPSKARKPKPKASNGTQSATGAAEGAARRIDALLGQLHARSAELVAAQRKSPHRWQHFAALASLEERLRQALSPDAG